jgi:hypothetical protein
MRLTRPQAYAAAHGVGADSLLLRSVSSRTGTGTTSAVERAAAGRAETAPVQVGIDTAALVRLRPLVPAQAALGERVVQLSARAHLRRDSQRGRRGSEGPLAAHRRERLRRLGRNLLVVLLLGHGSVTRRRLDLSLSGPTRDAAGDATRRPTSRTSATSSFVAWSSVRVVRQAATSGFESRRSRLYLQGSCWGSSSSQLRSTERRASDMEVRSVKRQVASPSL